MDTPKYQNESFYESLVSDITGRVFEKISLLMKEPKNLLQDEICSAPDLISPKETLKLFSPAISRTTLYNYTTKGLLTPYQIGRRVFYSRSEVIQQVKSNSIKKYIRLPHSK